MERSSEHPFVDLDLEIRVLASALWNGSKAFNEINEVVRIDDFYFDVHQKYFSAIQELFDNQGIEADGLADGALFYRLVQKHCVECSEEEIEDVYQRINDPQFTIAGQFDSKAADMLHDLAKKRRAFDGATDLIRIYQLNSKLNYEELAKMTEKCLNVNNEDSKNHIASAYSVAKQEIDKLNADVVEKIVPTGLVALDEFIGGLRPGTLNIIGARPGVGKTALGLNLVVGQITHDTNTKPWIIFSLEMSKEQIAQRLMASFAGERFTKDTESNPPAFKRFLDGVNNVLTRETESGREDLIYLADISGVDLSTLKGVIRQQARKYGGLGGIMLDYIQLMSIDTRKNNPAYAYGEISKALKQLAREYEMPIICLAQVNRSVEKQAPKDGQPAVPMMSDIRDSGNIEQDADIVIMMGRNATSNTATICVRKNRYGICGEKQVQFIGEAYRFADLNTNPYGSEYAERYM